MKRHGRKPLFMIHKHQATRLHYDLRLEIDGRLASWALYQLPFSASQSEKATKVPDHPFWYRHFEGVIPVGDYGAGPVMVWDKGLFDNRTYTEKKRVIPLKKCIEQGLLILDMHGHKMRGTYAFIRVSKKQRWFLIKLPDAFTIPPRSKPKNWNRSIKTNRTLEQILKNKKII